MSQDPADDPLSALRDEVFRRIGRTLLLMQRIEQMMKLVVEHATNEHDLDGMTLAEQRRRAKLKHKMMGETYQQYRDSVAGAAPFSPLKASETLTVQVRYSLPVSAEKLRANVDHYEALLRDRNELVHHFGTRFDLRTEAAVHDALDHLAALRERALAINDEVEESLKALGEAQTRTREFLSSPDGADALHAALTHKPLGSPTKRDRN